MKSPTFVAQAYYVTAFTNLSDILYCSQVPSTNLKDSQHVMLIVRLNLEGALFRKFFLYSRKSLTCSSD